jgi:hypothetical protein
MDVTTDPTERIAAARKPFSKKSSTPKMSGLALTDEQLTSGGKLGKQSRLSETLSKLRRKGAVA